MVVAVKSSKVTTEVKVRLRNSEEHPHQSEFIDCEKKRIIVKAGRRGGKTVGIAQRALKRFLGGRRQLYTAPTGEQTDAFWYEINRALGEAVDAGVYKKNETERYIELPGTKQRIKAKTAWNANTLRGDYADDLYFDEWQLTAEDAWDDVGEPMLLDNDGDAVFIYTPPSLKSSGVSRARDPLHAKKMFTKAREDTTGLWAAFHFTSHDNPFISQVALANISQSMSRDSYLKEIMAEDDEGQVNLLVYGCFDEKICKIPRFEIPEKWIIYTGHDFGSANPAALFIAQDPGTGFFYCYHEYVPAVGKSTFQNVQEFKRINVLPGYDKDDEKSPKYSIRTRVGGSHQEEELRQGYASQGWPITEPFVLRVGAQVDRAKQLMEKNKIFIFNDMYKLLAHINSCMWVLDDMGQPTNEIKDEKKYHLLACLRYVCSIFKPEREDIAKKNVVLQVIR